MAVGGGPLFGGSAARAQSKSLVEFRAGKMTLNAATKMVTPDKRKGLVSLYQDDQLMHFTWKDRGTGTLEDDLIIFPEDCEFQAVPACTTGRVFVLKFKTSNKRMFFWMQEPKADKDEEFCKKVNETLNNPPTGRAAAAGGVPSGLDFSNLGDSELQSLLNGMNQQQLMQLFGGSLNSGNSAGLASLLGGGGGRSRQAAGTGRTRNAASVDTPASPAVAALTGPASSAATVTPSTPANSAAAIAAATATPGAPLHGSAVAASPATPSIQLSDLQSILSNIQVPPGAEAVGGAGAATVDLAPALNAEALQPLLSNPEFLEKVKDFLPQGEKDEGKEITAEDLRGTVQSPQFQQAVSMFSMALGSGQLGPLVREFGLGEAATVAASQGDMLAFVKALQEGAEAESKKEDKPEDMALD